MHDSLISNAIGGDRGALQKLFELHHDALDAWLSQRLPVRWQSLLNVSDVLQETYIDALLDIRQFVPRGEDSFRSWLFTIARNNLSNAVKSLEAEKRGGTRGRVSVGEDAAIELFDLALRSSTPGRKAARSEAIALLMSALRQLPNDYQIVLQLYDLEGGSMREVAAALGRSEGAAFMMRHRALRAIEKLLLDPLAEDSSFS